MSWRSTPMVGAARNFFGSNLWQTQPWAMHRTFVHAKFGAARQMNTIVFASAKGQVGKSTLCRLYAEYYSAEISLKTLVVESNFFTSGKEYPVSDDDVRTIDEFILKSIPENEPVADFINRTEFENLFILPTKRISANHVYTPADEEAKENIRKLLDVESTTKFVTSCIERIHSYAEKEKFDFLLIDTTSDSTKNLNCTLIDRVLTKSSINGHIIAVSETDLDVLMETLYFIYKNSLRTGTSIKHQTLITNKTPSTDQITEVCRIQNIQDEHECFDKQLKVAAEGRNVLDFILNLDNVPLVLKENKEVLEGLEELSVPFDVRLTVSSPLPQPSRLLEKLQELRPNIQDTGDRIRELSLC